MNLGQILTRIETAIQDSSFTREDDLLPLVNEFVEEMSQLFRLPGLLEEGSVTATTSLTANKIALPDTYDKELYRVYNDTHMHMVSIRSNIKTLEALYDGMVSTGFITDVAVADGYLWFRPMPVDDQELTLFYYRKPVGIALVDGAIDDLTVELDGIPSKLSKFAVDYALKELFHLVEDGVDGSMINTEKYKARYQMALVEFQEHCRTAPKQTPVIPRKARFF